MKVIAVANMKGGVGKTTTVVALAEALAAEGSSVLVIDADAQANASVCIAGDQTLFSLISDHRTIDAFLDDYLHGARLTKFDDCIHENASGVSHGGKPLPISLLASSAHLRLLEREVVFTLAARDFSLNAVVGHIYRILREQLGKTKKSYEYVLIDCAPGISAVTEASLRISDLVIVPTIPDFLSTYGLQSFCRIIWKGSHEGATRMRPKALPKVLITRKRPVKEHERLITLMQNELTLEQPAFRLFNAVVPEAIAIAQALGKATERTTLTAKWGANMLPLLSELAQETREAINAA